MEERLVSRLEWGLLLHLSPLSGEGLLALTKQTCKNLFLNIDDIGIRFLCEKFSNPYFLTLACNAIAIRLTNEAKSVIPLEMIQQITKDITKKQKIDSFDYDKIISGVSQFYKIQKKYILGKSQEKEYLIPRQIAMYLCRNILNLTYVQIGRIFDRDHTTVIASIKSCLLYTSPSPRD